MRFLTFSRYLLRGTSPPNLPDKSERMQAPYKGKKQVMQYTSPLYWDVLSFSFTIIEFFLDISFWVAMQYTFIVYFL